VTDPIDITPGRPLPPPDPRVARRRLRLGLVVVGALASVLSGAVGYAVLADPPRRSGVVRPVVPAPAEPYGHDLLLGVPSAAPVSRAARPPGK
jgi:hypothetical protein